MKEVGLWLFLTTISSAIILFLFVLDEMDFLETVRTIVIVSCLLGMLILSIAMLTGEVI